MIVYVVPTVFTGTGNVATEYRLIDRKVDRRTSFHKRNGRYLRELQDVLAAEYEFRAKSKYDRIIFHECGMAIRFSKMLGIEQNENEV